MFKSATSLIALTADMLLPSDEPLKFTRKLDSNRRKKLDKKLDAEFILTPETHAQISAGAYRLGTLIPYS